MAFLQKYNTLYYIDFTTGALATVVAAVAALAALILARQQAGIPAMLVPTMPFSHLAAATPVQASFLPLAGLSPSWAKVVAAEASRARASRDFFMGKKTKNEQLRLVVASKVRTFFVIAARVSAVQQR